MITAHPVPFCGDPCRACASLSVVAQGDRRVCVECGEKWGGPTPPTPASILLRRLRLSAGLSLREAAEKTGLSPVRLGEYERGKRGLSVEEAQRLADVLVPLASFDEVLRDAGIRREGL